MSTHKNPPVPRNRDPCDPPSSSTTASFWHSSPSPLLLGHRSTRNLPKEADIVIIGTGMTGTSIAYHLLHQTPKQTSSDNKPSSLLLLEAREACSGATGRNGGHCQPLLYAHPHEPSIGRFELANYHALHAHITTHDVPCEFVAQSGVRALYSARHVTDAELALHAVAQAAPEQAKLMRLVTDKRELRELRVESAQGAVVTSVAGRMWPYKFVAHVLENLLMGSEAGRVNLQTLTPVEGIAPYSPNDSDGGKGDGRWRVQTPRGEVIAGKVVLATNGYTSFLLPQFADLIVPCRGQMSALLPLPSLQGEKRLRTSFGFESELGDYLIQRPNEGGGHLMYARFGGGRHKSRIYTTDDSEIDAETARYLRTKLLENLGLPEGKKHADAENANARAKEREREFTATHEWTGIMGFSRDEHPWVGRVPDKRNLYISAGYTGHGMVNTWLCGKAVAGMIAEDLGEGSAGEEVGLPESYLVSKARVERAMQEWMDIEAREAEEVEWWRKRREADWRPHSGYA